MTDYEDYFVAILLVIIVLTGWIANICQIVSALHDPLTALTIFKVIGVFVAPLGVVLGYIGFFI